MIKIVDKDFDKKVWNALAIHPLQSWQWGQAREQMGIDVLRIGDFKNEKLTNTFQITFHKLPYLNYSIGYLPRSVLPSKDMLNFMYKYAKQNRIIFIKSEPYEKKKSKLEILHSKLTTSPHPLFPNWTQIVDLTQTEQQLLAKMHPKTRYNIRLAQKKEVTVREVNNEEGFAIFANLYFKTTKRQHYFGHDYNYHKILWDNLKANLAHLLIAFYKDTPLAAYELFYFQQTLYYPYGGTLDQHRNLMASNLLMWEAIRLGKRLGASKFDLWGSLSPKYSSTPHSWAGFTRFKEGYGGDFIELMGSFDLIAQPSLYKLYNSVHQLREIYLQFKTA